MALLSARHVYNNPVKYQDPSGHVVVCGVSDNDCGGLPPDPRDLTPWMVMELNYLPQMPEGLLIQELLTPAENPYDSYQVRLAAAGGEFYNLVKDGATLDVKDNIEERLGNQIQIGDLWFEYSTPGNILYGFYGTAWGWSPTSLHAGAGFAQIMDGIKGEGFGTWELGFDTADDYAAIDFGIQLFNEAFAPDGIVTQGELLVMLSNFESLNVLQPATSTSNPVPLVAGWPYHQGFFNNDG